MDENPDLGSLVEGLASDSDSARKYAVFKLQQLLADPSFADAFVQTDGLGHLQATVLHTTGNTQAYAFGSLNALLELDMGWEAVDENIIETAVQVAVNQPLVNIVRNALTLIVLIASRPLTAPRSDEEAHSDSFGFKAVKPALDRYPGFLDSLVQRLSASDHSLCANALQCINVLMRDAIVNGGETEWPRFIKRLQDLGVIGGVGMLMRGEAAGDVGTLLSQAILEFQGLTKVLLRKWREVPVDIELPEHKRALKTIHLLSNPEPYQAPPSANGDDTPKKGRKHHPEKWRRLGFETESPAWEFDETGWLGIMDLVDYARRNESTFQKLLMEQAVQDPLMRCPIARTSVSVTLILLEHFEIEDADVNETEEYRSYDRMSQAEIDRLYKPLLLQWGRLHTVAMNAFTRLWKAAGAEVDDFYKVEEVVRIVVERIVGGANRRTDIAKIEEEMRNVSLQQARKWQMEGLDEIYDEAWGAHLSQVREQLHHESLQFMKEQRIRCLLQGAWFPTAVNATAGTWRYVRLSHNKRYLHYHTYSSRKNVEPRLEELNEKVDLNSVTAVDSDVTTTPAPPQEPFDGDANSSTSTLKDTLEKKPPKRAPASTTRITIIGTPSRSTKLAPTPTSPRHLARTGESVLLELFPTSPNLASEWLDGLLMLLNQQPITNDTTRLVSMMEDWGVRLRMLNLRWEDVDWSALESSVKGGAVTEKEVPSREGLDGDEYYYAMPET